MKKVYLGGNYSWGSGDYMGFASDWNLEKVSAKESLLYIFAGSSYFFLQVK